MITPLARSKAFMYAAIAAAGLWFSDSLLGFCFAESDARGFFDHLILDIPPDNLWMRLIIAALCLLGGWLLAKSSANHYQIEQHLKQERRNSEAVLENAPYGVIVSGNRPDSRILYRNRALSRITGYAPNAFETMSDLLETAFPDQDARTRILDRWDALLAADEIDRDELFSITCKNGEQRIVAVRSSNLDAERIIVAVNDVTERQNDQNALRTSRKEMATTLNSLSEAVITTNTDGLITFINPVAQRLTGYTATEALGQPFENIFYVVHEQTRQPIENPLDRIRHTLSLGSGPNAVILTSKHGIERPIYDSGAPIVDENGDVLGAVVIFRDMSRQRFIDAQLRNQQKLEAIGILAGGVAHEINNPINVIMNYGELIRAASEVATIKENAGEIIEEGKRIARIVRNLLTFGRQENESHLPSDISEIVDRTLSLTRRFLEKDHIAVQVENAPDLPRLRCRDQQIQQVLMNLITNARDALNQRFPGDNGPKSLTIRTSLLEEDSARWLRIEISDNGIGIKPEVRERIFDPFFTTKPRDKGTGLGLSVSHGIVRDHGGRLGVESAPEQGSRFLLDLPLS